FSTAGMSGLPERATLRQIVEHLRETYCGSIGVEFTHIEEPEPRDWLQESMESTRNHAPLQRAELLRILTKLTDAEILEQFIHKNYVGAKRFSLEGAESVIPMIDLLIESAGQKGIEELVIGMAHRGRINVLVNVMGKNVREIFAAFDDRRPERFFGAGDVKYHLGYSSDVTTRGGRTLHLSMAFNPSHLEFVNPVVEGRVRAKIDRRKRKSTMPLLVHGDAAFMGEGIIQETLNLSQLEGYSTGGTVHLVVNNQIGFTTVPGDSRSTRYCTDVARMLRVPIFHVNGEDPEAVIQVTRLAVEYRQRFKQDVVIDMYCYRKYGHNEGDEPRFTQPLMYALIDKKPTVREAYVARLVKAGHVTLEEADEIATWRRGTLEAALEDAREGDYLHMPQAMGGVWAPYRGGPEANAPEVPTTFPKDKLLAAIERLTVMPDGFHANPKAHKILEQRRDRAMAGQGLDWGTAEHLAFASILMEGHGIRISGQDSRRGTFSHRHAVLYDTETGKPYTPLANLGGSGVGRFEIYDSPLSEAGVLGFEYGYSLDRPDKLVVWEAQFGDFANAAQVIIDQFIVSAEDKWMRLSGLVLLLPHGFEGQGPEHSSARLERFLALSAEDNVQVCNPTTPAQFFHLLRRQVIRPWRKPLIVLTPKSLLRHPEAVSTIDELAGGSFRRVIPDDWAEASKVRRILLCSGKVYYDLAAERRKRQARDIAVVRLEQYYPLSDALAKALAPYREGTPVVWVQEEPRNMGAWYFMNARREAMFGARHPLSTACRPESASPATGSKAAHDLEQKMLLDEAFA
ncbi:MAG TPA: 2-oxoglutarate dehydrogenase E1 component, partial [Polyangiaceae bacterium]